MDEKEQKLEELRQIITSAEESLEAAKKALSSITGEEYTKVPKEGTPASFAMTDNGQVIEGTFDGENMRGPEEKVYPVPANYASKSKLVEGDRLKLTIAEDGSFIFKQIGPIERKKIVGTLAFENNAYHVTAEGKIFNVLFASVSYFKAKPGDKVTIVVPAAKESAWAALENIIHEMNEVAPEQTLVNDVSSSSENTLKDFLADEQPEKAPDETEIATENTEPSQKEDHLSDLPDFPDLDQKPDEELSVQPTSPTPEVAATSSNFFDTLDANGAEKQPEMAVASTATAPSDDLPADEAKDLDI